MSFRSSTCVITQRSLLRLVPRPPSPPPLRNAEGEKKEKFTANVRTRLTSRLKRPQSGPTSSIRPEDQVKTGWSSIWIYVFNQTRRPCRSRLAWSSIWTCVFNQTRRPGQDWLVFNLDLRLQKTMQVMQDCLVFNLDLRLQSDQDHAGQD